MALVGTKKPPQGGFFVSGVEIICLVIYPNGGRRNLFMRAATNYLGSLARYSSENGVRASWRSMTEETP